MYVGDYGIVAVYTLIQGFVLNDVISNRESREEREYLDRFDIWAKNKLNTRYKLDIDYKKNCIDTINMISIDEDLKVLLYINLLEEFFVQINS